MTMTFKLEDAPTMPRDPDRVLIYGVPGVGKSTLATKRRGTVLINIGQESSGTEVCEHVVANGGRVIGPITTLADLHGWLGALTQQQHSYTTLTLDSLTALQPLLYAAVLERANFGKPPKEHVTDIGDVGGGKFGAGWTMAADEIRLLLGALERLQRQRGMGVWLIAHADDKAAAAVEGKYLGYTLDLSPSGAKEYVRWAHAVLFARWEEDVVPVVGAKAADPGKLRSSGRRILRTQQDGPHVAKNRHQMPPVLPMDFEQLLPYLRGAAELRAACQALLNTAPQGWQHRQAVEDDIKGAGSDPAALARVETDLLAALAPPRS